MPMNNSYLIFCLGFVLGFVPLAVLIVTYYVRARRRVRKIQTAIIEYQKATREVQTASSKVFDNPQNQ